METVFVFCVQAYAVCAAAFLVWFFVADLLYMGGKSFVAWIFPPFWFLLSIFAAAWPWFWPQMIMEVRESNRKRANATEK